MPSLVTAARLAKKRKVADDGPKEFTIGAMSFDTKDLKVTLHCDRAAAGESGTLYLFSVAGSANQIKAVRAALADRSRKSYVTVSAEGLNFVRGEARKSFTSWPKLCVAEDGYRCFTERLAYNMAHAVFVAKAPAFLASVSGEALWQHLQSPQFTTPILRPWMYWITKRLLADRLLVYTFGHRAKCGLLHLTTPALDQIVSEGLRTGALELDDRMPAERRAAAVAAAPPGGDAA